MDALILFALIPAVLAILWVVQTILLAIVGEPKFALPLRHGSQNPVVRWGMKIALQLSLLGVLFGFPAIIGEDPIGYHRDRLHPANFTMLAVIIATAVLSMTPMFILNTSLGWVTVTSKYKTATAIRKVARSLLTPLPLAFVEEAVFRGLVLDQLLRAMPGQVGMSVALILSAVIFASVHFLRAQKRVLLPAIGLFGLGMILGSAYIIGGYSYWLPVGIHAGGVLFIQVSRPFVVYKGPAWLIGYASYPICGLFGLTSMALYVTGVWYVFQGTTGV